MAEDKKIVKAEAKKAVESKELNLDDLEEVTGGALRDASKKKTSSISSNTRSKI